MFLTVLAADLPSREVEGAAPGDDAYATSHDEVTYGSAHLLGLIRRAFSIAGVRDLAFIEVDGDVVFADHAQQADDEVDQLLERAAQAGFLGKPFDRMVLLLDHTVGDITHACEVVVRTRVPPGEPEMVVRVASRPSAFNPEVGESSADYANRVFARVAQELPMVADRTDVGGFCAKLGEGLRTAFHQGRVEVGQPELTVVRPDRDALQSLTALPFGQARLPTRYAIAPEGRWPRWDDPGLLLRDDPYLVLRHLLVLDAILEDGHLREPWVVITDGSGKALFRGNQASMFAGSPWRKRFQLTFDEHGIAVTFAPT